MTTFNLSAIMDGMAAQLVTQGVTTKAYGYPISNFESAPLAYVGYPKPGSMVFDVTFKRGTDSATFPVYFVVGKVADKASRDALSAIIDGAVAIKSGLESGTNTLGGTVSSVHVKDFDVENLPDTSTPPQVWLAARFDVEILT
jgi:hypothetical protein